MIGSSPLALESLKAAPERLAFGARLAGSANASIPAATSVAPRTRRSSMQRAVSSASSSPIPANSNAGNPSNISNPFASINLVGSSNVGTTRRVSADTAALPAASAASSVADTATPELETADVTTIGDHIQFQEKDEELMLSDSDESGSDDTGLPWDANGRLKSAEEREEELRQRWTHLPEFSGPGPFPEFQTDAQTHPWVSPVWASAIDMRRHIFCNRSLNMGSIVAVGFDMDYTLAQYRADTFEALAYKHCLQKLVYKFGFPEELLKWQFDWRYMVRGLVLDKKRGNILKMDRHKYVKVAYHGFRQLSADERRRMYNSTRARESFDEPDYALIDTLFSLAEAYLFAQLVDFCDAFPERCPPQVVAPGSDTVNYLGMYKNVRSAVDLCHRDGTLKSAVAQDPQKYLHKDEQIVPMLKMLRDSGRKVFLMTNSLWDYTHVIMNCIVGNDGLTPETQRNYDWLQLFDVVITGSAKPGFFQDSYRAPVFEVDVTTGMLYNTDEGTPGPVIGDLPPPPPARNVVQGCQVYQGGSVAHLHRLLNIASGSHVLYVGDHIYGDILRSKKTLGWRTMLVVPELVREVHVLHRTTGLQRAFHGYRHQIDSLDDTIQRMTWALRYDNLGEDRKEAVRTEMETLKVQREVARKKYTQVMDEWHSRFHPIWGMLMKTGYQNSRFGHQVERFACLYTSHVANMAFYSPDKNYRTVEDFMPHEVVTLQS